MQLAIKSEIESGEQQSPEISTPRIARGEQLNHEPVITCNKVLIIKSFNCSLSSAHSNEENTGDQDTSTHQRLRPRIGSSSV